MVARGLSHEDLNVLLVNLGVRRLGRRLGRLVGDEVLELRDPIGRDGATKLDAISKVKGQKVEKITHSSPSSSSPRPLAAASCWAVAI